MSRRAAPKAHSPEARSAQGSPLSRRSTRRAAGFAAGLLALCGNAWSGCGDALPERGRLLAGTPSGWQVAFVPVPGPLVAGKPFALDLVLCPASPGLQVTRLGVDAEMPAHKHGMNYRTVVKPAGDQRYRADGLLFHMPGRWRFLFELEVAPGQVIRLNREVDVP